MTGLPQHDEILDVLLRMRERLSDPENWCAGALERKHKHCLLGEVNFQTHGYGRIYNESPSALKVRRCLFLASKELFHTGPVNVNNDIGHDAVLAVLDRAITLRTEQLAETA